MITLTSGSARTVINPTGAWVEELVSNDQPILFPKTELLSDNGEKKARGGMHVCLPNFGPDSNTTLPQHGFGRSMGWDAVASSESTLTLTLSDERPSHYSGLNATLYYELNNAHLSTTLTLKNNGQWHIRVAPGFHPYFSLDESETAVKVNNVVRELSSLSGTEFLQADVVELQTSNCVTRLSQTNLPTWAIWTDQLSNYVCVEPTYGGYRFLEAATPDEYIAPGAEKTFSFTIGW